MEHKNTPQEKKEACTQNKIEKWRKDAQKKNKHTNSSFKQR